MRTSHLFVLALGLLVISCTFIPAAAYAGAPFSALTQVAAVSLLTRTLSREPFSL